MLIRDFTAKELIDFLKLELNDDELETLEKENKRKITVDDNNVKIDCSTLLEQHFNNIQNKKERNIAIVNAFSDEYTRSSIADYLSVTPDPIFS